MTVQKTILNFVYKCKPVLLKILPISWLRAVKKQIIKRNLEKISQLKYEPYQKGKYPDGINLIGNIRAETGLGQSCRLLAKELKACDYPMMIYNYDQGAYIRQNDNSWNKEISEECNYSINVIHINPHELGIAMMQLDRKIFAGRYNIGFWLWELEEFPDEWLPCISCMNEIWTPSEFISNSIRKKTNIPVSTIPYAIEAQMEDNFGRKGFGLPDDKFLFLMMYDNNSIAERKNPQGVIDAFKKAFPVKNKDVGLVIKINSADKRDVEKLRLQLREYENIYFITETLSREKVNSLIACADVVVSLHRAEGFGLVLAEAMYLGVPTIATNWSANTEFMNKEVACMVDYQLVEIEKDVGPFKKGQRWAEADLEQAAGYMRLLYEDKAYREKIAGQAYEYVREKLSVEQAVKKIEECIGKIVSNGER